ncbi:MAG: ABC transporter ATP-binding protein [Burkholderiales bacterium]|jgi:ABC-2 type transport system ATP-binding protein|nr:ABC transporter ATP-binding protein [Burkholderiales bacterium]
MPVAATEASPVPAVRVRGVTRRFDAFLALDRVDLDVPAGRVFGLVGVNGAGKTTLIRALLDASRPDGGDIAIFGESSRDPAARRHLAFLPERFQAPHHATGADFLALLARLHGRPWDRGGAEQLLAELDLDRAVLDRPVRTFSKGMTQKLGLAACLASQRPLLILDEPGSGLDPAARARLKAALRQRHAHGATVLMTSHALADVDEMCDTMAVLHAGRVRFVGPPAALRDVTGADTLEAAFLRLIATPAP